MPPQRTAILISCLKAEANEIREQARLDRRSLSNYLQKAIVRWLEFDERLYADLVKYKVDLTAVVRRVSLPKGPRAVVLWRCSLDESKRVRVAAQRRGMTISGFVRHCLLRTWTIQERITYRQMTQS